MDEISARSVSILGAEGNLRGFIRKAGDVLNIGVTNESDYEDDKGLFIDDEVATSYFRVKMYFRCKFANLYFMCKGAILKYVKKKLVCN